ncbi:MAG: SDR family NAD-dependent epimerase/dehydratase, partial [Roseovarius sp.]|nr:SDR family NAD-dependent epimerase/dehydratase [Roseovarius sp.]
LQPASDYGHAKLAMEANVAQLKGEGVCHCCLRLANVVGADSLAPALRAGTRQPVTLTRFQDGHGPRRSYVSPGHLLEILCALVRLPADHLPPLLNVSTSAPVEMEALARAAGKDIAWKARTSADTQTVTLSTRRLAALLPGMSLHKSAQDMIHDWQTSEAQA